MIRAAAARPPRRVGDVQGGLGDRISRDRHAAVAGHEHIDRHLQARARIRQTAERPGERVHDVGETAGLGPGLALGGKHRDS